MRKHSLLVLSLLSIMVGQCVYGEPPKSNEKQPAASQTDIWVGKVPDKVRLLLLDVGTVEEITVTENSLRSAGDVLEAIRDAIIVRGKNNKVARMAEGYLKSALMASESRDCVLLVERSENVVSVIKQAIVNGLNNVTPPEFFLTVKLSDQKHESQTFSFNAGDVKKSTYSRTAFASIINYRNEVLFSCDVKATKKYTDLSSVKPVHDPTEELIEDAMKQLAKKISDHFVTEFKVEADIPKDTISKGSCRLYIDQVKQEKSDDDKQIAVVQDSNNSIKKPITADKPFLARSKDYRGRPVEYRVKIEITDDDFIASPSTVWIGPNKPIASFTVEENKAD